MALYEYNGKSYFHTALGKWVDGQSNPVDPEIAKALSDLYPVEEIKAREKTERAGKSPSNKKASKRFVITNNTRVSGATHHSGWHKKASELPYNRSAELTADQKKALSVLESGANVFLTGEAGTGKSFVLREFMRRNKGKNIIVGAFTGIAAINIGGSTLHRIFKAPIGTIKPGDYNTKPSEALVKADVIVIDEISMCRIDLFEYVVRTIAAAERIRQYNENTNALNEGRSPRVLNSKQIIVVGDFYQLSPVIGERDEPTFYSFWNRETICDGFAFASPLWEELHFKNILLTEIVRQSGDSDYIENLNKIRIGDVSGIAWFNENISRTPLPNAIYLCGTNAKANAINRKESDALPGEAKIYTAKSSGTVGDGDKLTNEKLELKVGMQVMTLVNDMHGQYQNGSIGKIVALHDDQVDVRLNNGKHVTVVAYNWEINGFEVQNNKIERVVLGNYIQIPLKVAYAITIHKSQGQTYSNVNVSPDCFAPGQLYVALSRAQTAKGMAFSHTITREDLRTNFNVKRFYENLIVDDSEYPFVKTVMTEFKGVPEPDSEPEFPWPQKERRHSIFEKDMDMSDQKVDSCYMYKAIKNNPSAYAPWTAEEDNQLLHEMADNPTIAQMSNNHERTKGAIRSRIKKLQS